MPSPLGVPAAPSMIHQDSAYDLRTDGKEMYAVFAANGACPHQFKISFISQSR